MMLKGVSALSMLLCCGEDGLLEYRTTWQVLSCPLPVPSLVACSRSCRAILDNTEHLLWLNDRLLGVDSGIECMLLWQENPLLLSGDTNSLALLDGTSGSPLFLSPAGLYPQDMCLLQGNVVAVCGGDVGVILLMQLPELKTIREIPVAGCPQRLTRQGHWLYALCRSGEDGCSALLCRINPLSCTSESLYTLPGIPGALYAHEHSLWVSVSERVYRFSPHAHILLHTYHDLGLARHIAVRENRCLLSDPVRGALFLADGSGTPRMLRKGDVGQVAFL